MKKFVLMMLLAVMLAVSVHAADNQTNNQTDNHTNNHNQTNDCPPCNCSSDCPVINATNCTLLWQNISFHYTLTPGEKVKDFARYEQQKINLKYNLVCAAAEQEQSDVCSVHKKLSPGQDYSRHTQLCDIEMECRECEQPAETSCPTGNRTVEVPVQMQTRNNNKQLVIHIGEQEVVHSIDHGLDYSSTIPIMCPKCEEMPKNISWTYDMCKEYVSDLCFSEESANFMVTKLSGSINMLSRTYNNCTREWIITQNELKKCQEARKNLELTLSDSQAKRTQCLTEHEKLQKSYENCTQSLHRCLNTDKCKADRTSWKVLLFISIFLLITTVVFFTGWLRLKLSGGVS